MSSYIKGHLKIQLLFILDWCKVSHSGFLEGKCHLCKQTGIRKANLVPPRLHRPILLLLSVWFAVLFSNGVSCAFLNSTDRNNLNHSSSPALLPAAFASTRHHYEASIWNVWSRGCNCMQSVLNRKSVWRPLALTSFQLHHWHQLHSILHSEWCLM